jgi:hypothetical protein
MLVGSAAWVVIAGPEFSLARHSIEIVVSTGLKKAIAEASQAQDKSFDVLRLLFASVVIISHSAQQLLMSRETSLINGFARIPRP